MKVNLNILALFLILPIGNNFYSQIIDTLSYYYPYYPDSSNACTFVSACHQPGWCEPITTHFFPDSAGVDSSYNYYSIKKIRFCFTGFDQNIEFMVHLGDSFPSDTNKVYEDSFILEPGEFNANFWFDGIYVFKEIDVSMIQELQQIHRMRKFWISLNEKVFTLYNTVHPTTYQSSGNSFYTGLPSNIWHDSYCDWIIEVIVEFEKISPIYSPPNNNKIDEIFLYQNYPNPFNSNETIVKYQIPRTGHVQLTLYNVMGKKVMHLLNDMRSRGIYNLSINTKILPSGTYIYVLRLNNRILSSRRLTIIK